MYMRRIYMYMYVCMCLAVIPFNYYSECRYSSNLDVRGRYCNDNKLPAKNRSLEISMNSFWLAP